MPSQQQIADFLKAEFPQSKCVVRDVGAGHATVCHPVGIDELRPGGTVAGPVLMALADVALYVAILGTVGIVPLAVTTSLNINFLRKPAGDRDVVGTARLMKVGRTLVIGEVTLCSEGDDAPVAHVVATYALPAGRS